MKLTLFKLSSVPCLPLHCATYATLSSVVNFLSTYSDKKSSTTLQNNARSLSVIAELLVLRQYLHKKPNIQVAKDNQVRLRVGLGQTASQHHAQSPARCTSTSPPINRQCTNHRIAYPQTKKHPYSTTKKTVHHQHHYYHNTPVLHVTVTSYKPPYLCIMYIAKHTSLVTSNTYRTLTLISVHYTEYNCSLFVCAKVERNVKFLTKSRILPTLSYVA